MFARILTRMTTDLELAAQRRKSPRPPPKRRARARGRTSTFVLERWVRWHGNVGSVPSNEPPIARLGRRWTQYRSAVAKNWRSTSRYGRGFLVLSTITGMIFVAAMIVLWVTDPVGTSMR